MPGSPGAAARYRPPAPTNPLKELVEENLDALFRDWDARFRKDHGPLHLRLRMLFEEFMKCGDPHFGFLRLRCPDCGEEKILPFSCKSRGLCPSCAKKRVLVIDVAMAAGCGIRDGGTSIDALVFDARFDPGIACVQDRWNLLKLRLRNYR